MLLKRCPPNSLPGGHQRKHGAKGVNKHDWKEDSDQQAIIDKGLLKGWPNLQAWICGWAKEFVSLPWLYSESYSKQREKGIYDIGKGETIIIKSEVELRKGPKVHSLRLSSRGFSRGDCQNLERDGEEISEEQVDLKIQGVRCISEPCLRAGFFIAIEYVNR